MRRLAAIILGAVVVGALLSLLKGAGGGARFQFGNLSAPWLAVGFIAGVCYKRVDQSAAVGIVATVAALFGFYAEQSPLRDFSSGSLTFLGHPAEMYDFIVTPHVVIFIGGILTGVLFGRWALLGRCVDHGWRRRRSHCCLYANRSRGSDRAPCLAAASGTTGGCGQPSLRSAWLPSS